jgi:hypothetical protein
VEVVIQGMVEDVRQHRPASYARVGLGPIQVGAQSADERFRVRFWVRSPDLGGTLRRRSLERLYDSFGLDSRESECEGRDVTRWKKIDLAVYMLQSTEDDALETLGLIDSLEIVLCADDSGIERSLISESVNILLCLGIQLLQALCELVAKTVDETEDAATDLDGRGGTGRLGCSVDQLVIIGSLLEHNKSGIVAKEIGKLIDL